MARTERVVNVEIVDQFPVFGPDGFSKLSGLSSGDFSVTIYHDAEVQSGYPFTISETGSPGEYEFRFTPNLTGFWLVEVAVSLNREIWFEEYDVSEQDISGVYTVTRRALGLIHENVYIDQTVYDVNGQMVSCRVRLFRSKAETDLATDGGSSPPDPTPLAQYRMTTVWEGINQYQTFKQTLEP